jgi:SAM-dependent methyltransferase
VTAACAPALRACPACGSAATLPFLDLGDVPAFCNVQWPTREAAMASPRGPLSLNACSGCGHVFNRAFDSARMAYAPGYENSQHASSVFREYAENLVRRLIERYDVRHAHVVDIGCGRGDLLALMCERGGNRGFGFDPSYAGPAGGVGQPFEVVREYFGVAQARSIKPRLVCCRHVLEHIEEPVTFLRTLHEAMVAAGAPVLYLEVPSGEELLSSNGLWDYLYEHVSYFTTGSLTAVLEAAGFEVLTMYRDFGGQFLCADVRVAAASAADIPRGVPPQVVPLGDAAESMRHELESWRAWAADLRAPGSVALWGAGSKGVMFLNLLGLRADGPVRRVVDQNAAKHGRFVSGTGQEICPPEALRDDVAHEVVLMNGIYAAEVKSRLNALGLDPKLTIAWPPRA